MIFDTKGPMILIFPDHRSISVLYTLTLPRKINIYVFYSYNANPPPPISLNIFPVPAVF